MGLRDFILTKEGNFNIQDIKIAQMNAKEKEITKLYVDITSYIQEIEQLFRIYRINVKILLNFYRLGNDDKITKNYDFNLEDTDEYIINSLVINCISSGKTLKESIENFMRQFVGENNEINIKFKNECLSKLYDDVFAYRLLLHMRNSAQHGHLIVSKGYQNKYCFDIEQILSTPHFNINAKLKQEMRNIRKEIYDKYGDHPRILFTLSIAEFNYCIIKTYKEFLETIEGVFKEYVYDMNKLIKDRPDIIYMSKDNLNGFIFYEDDEDGLHCFNPNEDPLKMFNEIKNKALIILKEEEKELEFFKEGFVVV